MAGIRRSKPQPPVNRPNPIQNFQFTPEDFKNPGKINALFQQLIPALNGVIGAGGPSVLASGVDVKGATVSGLGAPKSETDAISSGHAAGTYSPSVVGPQLDIGGEHTLKGLSNLYLQLNRIQALLAGGITATVPLAKLTTGGANGSMTFTNGILTAVTNPT